jgi:hypothetical protein
MGLLDDAIREHLDLKRRRGADPAEIERAEREALGPVRRRGDPEDPLEEAEALSAAPVAEADAGEVHPAPSVGLPYHSDEHELGDAPRDHEFAEPIDHDVEEHAVPAASGPAPVPAVPPPYLPVSPPSDELRVTQPAAADAPTEAHEIEHDDEQEHEDPLDEHGDPHEEQGDPHEEQGDPHEEEGDPLEETPEFLQESPEHDRLWFEQRPPRDFDFDG